METEHTYGPVVCPIRCVLVPLPLDKGLGQFHFPKKSGDINSVADCMEILGCLHRRIERNKHLAEFLTVTTVLVARSSLYVSKGGIDGESSQHHL